MTGDLPIGISDFTQLRGQKKRYVDKTDHIGSLAENGGSYHLTAPAGVGKSLLISTLASLFENGLTDFQGLSIEKRWSDRTYPVVRIAGGCLRGFESRQAFDASYRQLLIASFGKVGFRFNHHTSEPIESQLCRWMDEQADASLVLLIDNYDVPFREARSIPCLTDYIHCRLLDFFTQVQSCAGVLRFMLMTGTVVQPDVLAEFQCVNLNHISERTELLGFTESEIRANFGDYLVGSNNEDFDTPESRFKRLCEYNITDTPNATKSIFNPGAVLDFLMRSKS